MSRLLLRGALALLLLLALASAALLADGWTAFGSRAAGERLDRMQASAQWAGKGFENPQPLWNDWMGMLTSWSDQSPAAEPDAPLPIVPGDRSRFAAPPESGLRVTWLGHSAVLMEVDGVRLLTDPVFGGRASPFDWAGPKAWYEPPIPLSELPPIDAVLISHDHYDHLQLSTILAMAEWDSRFIVPLGVGAHLEGWGIDPARIVEVDWWDRVQVGAVEVVSTPSRHASGRFLTDRNATLWSGYAVQGPEHRVYFSGDTGLFPAMAEIGERLGPFDLVMIEVGAYHRAWPDWHIGPEQAIRAHGMVRGKVFLPIHWGMWNLALHGWTEPVERVIVAAEAAGVDFAIPRPGESIEPASPPPLVRWWPELPWQTAAEHPIVSTGVD